MNHMVVAPMEVQVRYRNEPVTARLIPDGVTQARLVFEIPQFSITPGQAAVFYAEDLLLGGGLVTREMDQGGNRDGCIGT